MINHIKLSPKELDSQSKIRIDRWIELDSEECRSLDDNYAFTKQCLKLGLEEPAMLAFDSSGRIWGRGVDNVFYPFHMEYKGQLIGYRLSKKAAN